MSRVRREHEKIDLFWADIVALQLDCIAQCLLQLSLNHCEKSFVGKRLTPEFYDELIFHRAIVSPTTYHRVHPDFSLTPDQLALIQRHDFQRALGLAQLGASIAPQRSDAWMDLAYVDYVREPMKRLGKIS
jgi:hypothetical protein